MKTNQSKKLAFLLIFAFFILQEVQSAKPVQCEQNQIADNNLKKCYNEKKECPNIVSFDGKECVSQCNDTNEYIQTFENYKQCKICRDFIKEEQDADKNITIKCVAQCDENESVYLFGNQNSFKKCVNEYFCANNDKPKSAKNPKICTDACIRPEINFSEGCLLQCQPGQLIDLRQNKCSDICDKGFISCNNNYCVQQCEKIFEVADDQNPEKCKKCQINEYLSFESGNKGVCTPIVKSQDGIESMRKALTKKLDSISMYSIEEFESTQNAINTYSLEIEDMFKTISSKADKTQQDSQQAQTTFQNLLKLLQFFIRSTQNELTQKIVNIGSTELTVITQLAYPGQKFKTSFNSKDIKKGSSLSLLEKDSDEGSPKFSPLYLQVSCLKNNIFCQGAKCSESPSLYVVTHIAEIYNRALADAVPQSFYITHDIPQGQESSRFQCLSYDASGNMTRSQGELKNNQITCKFEYSSSLFYDEKCEFVDKQNCIKKIDESKEQNNDKETTSSSILYVSSALILLLSLFF